jgi:hypothetical protein
MADEWDKPSEALKRMAAAKTPEQFRRCTKCGHRHTFMAENSRGVKVCSTSCPCSREVLES